MIYGSIDTCIMLLYIRRISEINCPILNAQTTLRMPEDRQLPDLDRLSDSILWTVCTLLTFTKYTFTQDAIYNTIHKVLFSDKSFLHISTN